MVRDNVLLDKKKLGKRYTEAVCLWQKPNQYINHLYPTPGFVSGFSGVN